MLCNTISFVLPFLGNKPKYIPSCLYNRWGFTVIPYSRKYWRSLNLVVWPQTERKKYWRNLNLAVALRSVKRHYKHCERVYQGALPSSCLRYLNKAVSSQIYKKYNWQHVNDELAIRTACEKGRRAGPRALQHVALRARPI